MAGGHGRRPPRAAGKDIMTVKNLHTIAEWRNLLDDPQSRLIDKFVDLYWSRDLIGGPLGLLRRCMDTQTSISYPCGDG